MTFIVMSQIALAQENPSNIIEEEESAEVFLEEYTDEFQNTFFEALKQKGIQNYDRAINLLLECKQLDVNNNAVNHELAKTYLLDKRYIPAQQYAIEALVAEPENYWMLSNLMEIVEKQGVPFQTVQGTIPFENKALQFNLAQIYFTKKNFEVAKGILESLETNQATRILLQKINDSLELNEKQETVTNPTRNELTTEVNGDTELTSLRNTLKRLARDGDNALEEKAIEAVENYPLQPDFYYYHGLALNNNASYEEAISVLEEGLNYVFDHDELTNNMYKELARAYKALGNDSKANSYLSKTKPGFQ